MSLVYMLLPCVRARLQEVGQTTQGCPERGQRLSPASAMTS